MIDDGGDRRLYSSSSVSCFYPFLLLTTGNCQHLAVVTFVALVNGSLLRKAGLLLRALPPPFPRPFGPTLDVCLMFLPFCTDLFIERNKSCVEAEPPADQTPPSEARGDFRRGQRLTFTHHLRL